MCVEGGGRGVLNSDVCEAGAGLREALRRGGWGRRGRERVSWVQCALRCSAAAQRSGR